MQNTRISKMFHHCTVNLRAFYKRRAPTGDKNNIVALFQARIRLPVRLADHPAGAAAFYGVADLFPRRNSHAQRGVAVFQHLSNKRRADVRPSPCIYPAKIPVFFHWDNNIHYALLQEKFPFKRGPNNPGRAAYAGPPLKAAPKKKGHTRWPCTQEVKRPLPFARRRASTLRPFLVDILFLNPCSFFLWIFLG